MTKKPKKVIRFKIKIYDLRFALATYGAPKSPGVLSPGLVGPCGKTALHIPGLFYLERFF